MTRNLVALCILSFSLAGVGLAQATDSSAQNGTQLTKAQAKQLLHSAHTPDQYRVLADYYGNREKYFQQQAAEERHEWIRRSQNVIVVAAKYPRPADSARNHYEYYASKQKEAGQSAEKFAHLAAPDSPTN
jgi:glutamate/tyrosine decarboxylase-like PLP-dependent enzyme